MALFNISFDESAANLGDLSAGERQAILDTLNAAGEIWSWYLAPAGVTLEMKVIVDDAQFGAGVLAVGGPNAVVNTGTFDDGVPVYEMGPDYELRTGVDPNGATADLSMGLTVSSIRNLLYFRPGVTATTDTVVIPSGRYDALTVFLHEIGHGLGIISYSKSMSDAMFNTRRSVFDSFITSNNFTGGNFNAAAGGQSILLDAASISHFSEGENGRFDLMSSGLANTEIERVSLLDLGILMDLGLTLRTPTGGDDVIHDAGRPEAAGAGTLLKPQGHAVLPQAEKGRNDQLHRKREIHDAFGLAIGEKRRGAGKPADENDGCENAKAL